MKNLQLGAAAYKSGNHEEARKYFIAALKENPQSEQVWQWFYQVAKSDKERFQVLNRILKINPENKNAKALMNKLVEPPSFAEKARQAPKKKKNNSTNIILGVVGTLVLICLSLIAILLSTNTSFGEMLSPENVVYTQTAEYTQNIPTAAPASTNTSEPTATPELEGENYKQEVLPVLNEIRTLSAELATLLTNAAMNGYLIYDSGDSDWKTQVAVTSAQIEISADKIRAITPPPDMASTHAWYLKAANELNKALDTMKYGIDYHDNDAFLAAAQNLQNYAAFIEKGNEELLKHTP